jgi:hypothetical protein
VLLKRILLLCILLAGVVLTHSLSLGAPLMVEKNIFAQDRKPPPPDSVSSTPQAPRPNMPISNIQLDGVMVNGNSKKALVRLKSGQPGAKKAQSPFVTVREGQQIGDYRVVRIESKSLSLEKDGQNFTINLFAEGKIATPVTAQAPPVNPNPNPANQNATQVPGSTDPIPPPVPIPPNQRVNLQPRVPGQDPQQVPPANVVMDPNQQIPGQVDPNAAAQEQSADEDEE